MDQRWSSWAIKYDEFEQIRASIGTKHEIAGRILTDLLDDQRVLQGVVDIVGIDAMFERGAEHLHP